MKLFILLTLIVSSNFCFASQECKLSNQWKCDLFNQYDLNGNNLIESDEYEDLFENEFKEHIISFLTDKLQNQKFAQMLAKPTFKYHTKFEELVDISKFKSLWKLAKFLISQTSNKKIQMDYSDFVLALKSFEIPKA